MVYMPAQHPACQVTCDIAAHLLRDSLLTIKYTVLLVDAVR